MIIINMAHGKTLALPIVCTNISHIDLCFWMGLLFLHISDIGMLPMLYMTVVCIVNCPF